MEKEQDVNFKYILWWFGLPQNEFQYVHIEATGKEDRENTDRDNELSHDTCQRVCKGIGQSWYTWSWMLDVDDSEAGVESVYKSAEKKELRCEWWSLTVKPSFFLFLSLLFWFLLLFLPLPLYFHLSPFFLSLTCPGLFKFTPSSWCFNLKHIHHNCKLSRGVFYTILEVDQQKRDSPANDLPDNSFTAANPFQHFTSLLGNV